MLQDNIAIPVRKNRRLVNEKSNDSLELGPIVGYAQEPTMSLLDACKPLVDIVTGILKYAAIAIELTSDHPADSLTRDESASVRLYTMEWTDNHESLYIVLNRTLREDARQNLRPWFRYLKLFLSALVKLPCAQTQTVWRGLRHNASESFSRATAVIWWSFSSCTTVLTVLENELYLGQAGERTLFSIEVFNARNISTHSHFPNEDEILLLPGTYMELRSQLNPATDLHIIHLRQIIPKTMLLEPPFEGAQLYPADVSNSFCRRFIELLMPCFITYPRYCWHWKKKVFIVIGLFTIICIVAAILGSTLRRKSTPASLNLSPSTHWAENATTVAGQSSGTPGSAIDYLSSNRGISISSDDILYIADRVNYRVVFVKLGDPTTIRTFGSGPGYAVNQFGYLGDVAVTEASLYTLDTSNYRVQKWSRNGTNPILMPGAGSLNMSFNLFIDKHENLYLSYYSVNQVVCIAKNSSSPIVVAGTGTAGSSSNALNLPNGIYVDDARTLYIADTGNHRIQKWTYGASSGNTVAGTGVAGNNLVQLASPESLTVDKNGYMYIVDRGNNRIVRWASNATSGFCVVACTDTSGNLANQLFYPIDLAFDRNGSLYVSDDGNNRVQKFQLLN